MIYKLIKNMNAIKKLTIKICKITKFSTTMKRMKANIFKNDAQCLLTAIH